MLCRDWFSCVSSQTGNINDPSKAAAAVMVSSQCKAVHNIVDGIAHAFPVGEQILTDRKFTPGQKGRLGISRAWPFS